MIKTLRKWHLQVWIAMAVLIPSGIIAAVMVTPGKVSSPLLQPAAGNLLPLVLKKITKEGYTVILRTSTDTSALELEWINKSILTSPSALIYQVPSFGVDIDKSNDSVFLVGRIESKGTYYFPLSNSAVYKKKNFVVYDILHHQKIDSLTF